MQVLKLYLLVALGSLCLFACDDTRIFEKDIDFSKQEWPSTDTLAFTLDLSTNEPVNVYVNVRHRFDFNWRNVWLNLAIHTPSDSLFEMPINVPLSQPDGQWFGDCSGDICRLQFPLDAFTNYTFNDSGKYTFLLSHEMREDPLLEIMSAGIRIERFQNLE